LKLRELAKGTRAVKAVPFRLANAPEPPPEEGQDPHVHMVGVRVMTGDEIAAAYEKAQTDVAKRGVAQWLDTHPLCRLYLMAHTLAVACVDNEARDEPFFVSAQQVMSSPEVGGDNIAYLFEQQQAWQAESALDAKGKTPEEVIGLLAMEAARTENAESPFDRMPRATLVSCLRSSARLLTTLLMGNSDTGSSDDSNSSETPKNSESESSGG
jgi:hypothetical protein